MVTSPPFKSFDSLRFRQRVTRIYVILKAFSPNEDASLKHSPSQWCTNGKTRCDVIRICYPSPALKGHVYSVSVSRMAAAQHSQQYGRRRHGCQQEFLALPECLLSRAIAADFRSATVIVGHNGEFQDCFL